MKTTIAEKRKTKWCKGLWESGGKLQPPRFDFSNFQLTRNFTWCLDGAEKRFHRYLFAWRQFSEDWCFRPPFAVWQNRKSRSRFEFLILQFEIMRWLDKLAWMPTDHPDSLNSSLKFRPLRWLRNGGKIREIALNICSTFYSVWIWFTLRNIFKCGALFFLAQKNPSALHEREIQKVAKSWKSVDVFLSLLNFVETKSAAFFVPHAK